MIGLLKLRFYSFAFNSPSMDLAILEELGLTKAEVRVYLALLELGSVPSGRIVRETGFRKSTVYETIGRLGEKGFVSHIHTKGMKHFEAATPDRILEYLEEKKRTLFEQETKAKFLVRTLAEGFDVLRPHAEAHVLTGVEGFKTMRRDVLRHAKGEHFLIGAISRENEVMPAFFEHWNKERQKEKICLRILHKESARGKASTHSNYMGKYFETRFLPEEIQSPAVINIYGDRVVNVLWKRDQPVCFQIINKEIADSYRQYFEYLWKLARR